MASPAETQHISGREVILHIGSDKAGSSAIQSALWTNRETLFSQGIFVPRGWGHGRLLPDYSKETLDKLRSSLDEQPLRRVLLSWEQLHFLDQHSLEQLAQCFSGYAFRVVFYIRDQAEIIQSGLLQEIKGGRRSVNFEDECRHAQLPDNRNYYNTVCRWNRAIPEINWHVVLYDRSLFPKGDVTADFFTRIGAAGNTRSVVQGPVNTRLDVASARLINYLESLYTGNSGSWTNARRTDLSDLVLRSQLNSPLENGNYYLGAAATERVRDHYQSGNEKLVQEYGTSARLLERHPIPRCDLPPDAQLKLAIERLLDIDADIAQTPVFTSAYDIRSPQEIADFLFAGWYELEGWGCWCSGHTSTIRARYPVDSARLPWNHLDITLQGRYVCEGAAVSEVWINGSHRGLVDLRDQVLSLEKSEVGDGSRIDIELRHSHLSKPEDLDEASDDSRPLSYGLEAIFFEVR